MKHVQQVQHSKRTKPFAQQSICGTLNRRSVRCSDNGTCKEQKLRTVARQPCGQQDGTLLVGDGLVGTQPESKGFAGSLRQGGQAAHVMECKG